MDYILLLGWLAACAVQDAQQRKIANSLTFGMLAVALLYLTTTGTSLIGARPGEAFTAMAIACLLSLPGYLTRRMGAADVKMLIALGAATDSLHVLFSVIGAALALGIWLGLSRTWPAIPAALPERLIFLRNQAMKEHPYAPFLCIGFAITAACLIGK